MEHSEDKSEQQESPIVALENEIYRLGQKPMRKKMRGYAKFGLEGNLKGMM